MDHNRKHALPIPQKKSDDLAEVIWGNVKGTFETQAISDKSRVQPQTGVSIPSDTCVKENKDWVDFNEK